MSPDKGVSKISKCKVIQLLIVIQLNYSSHLYIKRFVFLFKEFVRMVRQHYAVNQVRKFFNNAELWISAGVAGENYLFQSFKSLF